MVKKKNLGKKKTKAKVKKSRKKLPPLPILKKKSGDVKDSVKKESKLEKGLSRVMRKEKDIAMDFAEKVQKKFDRMVKASVLFGSNTQAKDNATAGSDIDVILIVDDASINWDLELVSWYREELGKLIAAQPYGRDLHVNTVRLTTWWNDLLHGDPVVVNILRYGEALIDYGSFFNPLKALLLEGKMRSTPEAVYVALQRVPVHIARSKAAEMGAIEGAYWAMVDSAQAALMTAGKMPPSPEHIPDLLKTTFVDAGMLNGSYVKAMRDLYVLHKTIAHRKLGDIKGEDVDKWQNLSEKFLTEITRIIDALLEGQKG